METTPPILLVDDQPDLLDNIQLALEVTGYQVLTASDGQAALEILQAQQVSLILADIAMPGMNGYQLFERVRTNPQWVTIPFLFLTARALDSDIRYGKELGVDDYLTKPIEVEDLVAAVRGKLRRAQQLATGNQAATSPAYQAAPAEVTALTIGQLKIDTHQYQAWRGEQPLNLSARQLKLLVYLAQRPDQVVPPEELVKVTHDLETDHVEAGTLLRPMIRTLRRKLGYAVGEMGCIENVRGVGYRLIVPE